MFGADNTFPGLRFKPREPSRGGARPGRRYVRISGQSTGRTIEIIRWIDEKAKWEVRTVLEGGSLGRTSNLNVTNLRGEYRPV
jgi:hypothetical protein